VVSLVELITKHTSQSVFVAPVVSSTVKHTYTHTIQCLHHITPLCACLPPINIVMLHSILNDYNGLSGQWCCNIGFLHRLKTT